MVAASSRASVRALDYDPTTLSVVGLVTLLFSLVQEFRVPWVEIPLGLFVLFFAPGYGVAALLFGRQPLPSLAANMALIVGFSVLTNVVFGTLLLAGAVSPLTPLVGLLDAMVCLVAAGVQYRRPLPRAQRPPRRLWTAFELRGFSAGQKAAAYALFVGILITFGAIGYLAAFQPAEVPNLSLTIVGPDGTSGTIPSSGIVNATYTVLVQIQNNDSAQSFRLVVNSTLVGANATNRTSVPWVLPLALAANVTSSDSFDLSAGASGSVTVEFQFATTGDYAITFALAPAASAVAVRSALIGIVIS